MRACGHHRHSYRRGFAPGRKNLMHPSDALVVIGVVNDICEYPTAGMPRENLCSETTLLPCLRIFPDMHGNDSAYKVSLLNRYVQSLCGLYSRVARQLGVDRSYVSRVARGERRSEPIEQALVSEFDRIVTDDAG